MQLELGAASVTAQAWGSRLDVATSVWFSGEVMEYLQRELRRSMREACACR